MGHRGITDELEENGWRRVNWKYWEKQQKLIEIGQNYHRCERVEHTVKFHRTNQSFKTVMASFAVDLYVACGAHAARIILIGVFHHKFSSLCICVCSCVFVCIVRWAIPMHINISWAVDMCSRSTISMKLWIICAWHRSSCVCVCIRVNSKLMWLIWLHINLMNTLHWN